MEANTVHNKKYNYSKVEYINNNTKVCIICPEHGEFYQIPKNHLHGSGCPICGRERTTKSAFSNTKSFIEKAKKVHNTKYDYSKVNYTSFDKPVEIICKTHGSFFQKPILHLSGCGCQYCAKELNISETKLFNEIKKYYPSSITQYKPEWLKNGVGQQSLDIFIPELKIAIEYQGSQHFTEKAFYSKNKFHEILKRDKLKYEKCKKNGVLLLYFTYETKYLPTNYFGKIFINIDDLLKEITYYVENNT